MGHVKHDIEQTSKERRQMMEKKNNTIDKSIQNAIDRLVSEEWFAGQMYKQFILLVDNEERSQILNQMLDISNDEIDDHLHSLVDFALSNGFSVPTTYNEMKNHASREDVKLFESCEKGKPALFYVQKAVESENRAIELYQMYIDDYDFAHDYQDLKTIVLSNYYDEIDHLKSLQFIQSSIEAMHEFN